jgi:hypothetical protein
MLLEPVLELLLPVRLASFAMRRALPMSVG